MVRGPYVRRMNLGILEFWVGRVSGSLAQTVLVRISELENPTYSLTNYQFMRVERDVHCFHD